MAPTVDVPAEFSRIFAGSRVPEHGRDDPANETKRALNLRPDPIDFRDVYYEPRLTEVGGEKLPPSGLSRHVRDQGKNDPSCTGQALAALVDIQQARRFPGGLGMENPAFERASARMLYEMARAHDEFDADDVFGSTIRGALKGFYHNGVCRESLARFYPGTPYWTLEVDMAKDARSCGLGAYFRLRHVLYDYHAALTEAGGILCSAMTHAGWEVEEVEQRGGRIHLSNPAALRGAHAFVLVGYDSTGFLLLNSVGDKWGGFTGPDGLRWAGIAHWSYEDWARHVLDAWVIRLQIPAADTFHLTGGWDVQRHAQARKGTVTTPRIHINGHYVNLSQGRFVLKGAYPTTLEGIERTAALPSSRRPDEPPLPYRDILIIADGGLDPLERAVERAARLTPWLKGRNIYPVFIFWHSGLLDRIVMLLEHQAAGLQQRYGTGNDLDWALEQFGRDYADLLWRPIYEDSAHSAFAGAPPRAAEDLVLARGCPGHGWDAWAKLVASPLLQRPGVRLHLAAHSFGAILLGQLLLRAKSEKTGLGNLASLTLFAPACSLRFYRDRFATARSLLRKGPGARRPTIYTLAAEREAADQVGPYRGSILQYMWAATRERPLGLNPAPPEPASRLFRRVEVGASALAPGLKSHQGFLEDPDLLDRFISDLVGTRRSP